LFRQTHTPDSCSQLRRANGDAVANLRETSPCGQLCDEPVGGRELDNAERAEQARMRETAQKCRLTMKALERVVTRDLRALQNNSAWRGSVCVGQI
jgi:hypothetical protein